MAFPDSIQTFLRAKDPITTQQVSDIKDYQALMEQGNFTGAISKLAQISDGIAMNISAGRWNQVLETIEEIEEFYYGLNGVKAYIQANINKYKNINVWDRTTTYSIGNIVQYNGVWYVSKANNNLAYPPTNERFWEVFLKNQPAKQYPIQELQPESQNVDDLWFQIIEK